MIFFLTTFIFIIFIIISYYLGVIRLSVPLVIIYFIFIFNYFINLKNYQEKNLSNLADDEYVIDQFNNDDYSKISEQKELSNINEKINKAAPKPIVSYNPKPIIIDSNIIINKDFDKKVEYKKIIKTDTLNKSLKNKKENNNLFKNLKLNEIMICRGIYKRNPIKPGYNFINNVDSLFCYTKISNSGSKQEIKHIWFYENKEISSVIYNIKTSYNYRSWSKKKIYPKQIGKWRVDVVDQSGNVLGSRDFSVKSINNTY